MSYKPEVIADASGKWCGNALRFATYAEAEANAKDLFARAEETRDRTIKLDDLKGGTFTITNIGTLGGIFATPVINHPECAILAIGAIKDKPVVIDGKAVIRKMLPVSLTFDHRIIDGAQAARFVNDLKKHLEDPNLMLLEAF